MSSADISLSLIVFILSSKDFLFNNKFNNLFLDLPSKFSGIFNPWFLIVDMFSICSFPIFSLTLPLLISILILAIASLKNNSVAAPFKLKFSATINDICPNSTAVWATTFPTKGRNLAIFLPCSADSKPNLPLPIMSIIP